jgi:molybdate transport system substrate-binding protein
MREQRGDVRRGEFQRGEDRGHRDQFVVLLRRVGVVPPAMPSPRTIRAQSKTASAFSVLSALKMSALNLVTALAVVLTAAACAAPAPPPAATPTTLRVLSSNGVRAAIEAVQPQIEAAVGRRLSTEFSTAVGLKRKIDGGETFDVVILTPVLIDDLVKQGKATAASRVDVARTGVGVGAREGTPRSDVSTPDGLKRTLLDARSVAYTAEGQSRATVDKALARLGIGDAVAAKAMLTGPGEGPAAVAAGKADLVMTLVSEILIPGVQLLGPFPEEMQNYIVFTAARSPNAQDPAAADALLRALTSPPVATSLKAHALEPVGR